MLDLDSAIKYVSSSYRNFEKGERHVSRYSQENVLILMLDGTLTFDENGKTINLKKGDYYVQEKNLYQTAQTESDCPYYYYVHFDGEWNDSGLERMGKFEIGLMLPMIEKLEGYRLKKGNLLQKNMMLYTILNDLYTKNQIKRNVMAERIMEALTKNAYENVTIESIAKSLYISTNYLISIFKSEYGITPRKHVTMLRLEQAVNLLKTTDRKEEEIADEVGYSDFTVFYKAFKSHYGIPPSKLRK